MTGLRGVAALSVMVGHVLVPFFPAFRCVAFADAAVDIFFCLSGFTLCYHYGLAWTAKVDWRSYAVARVARVYPLYIATFLLAWWCSATWDLNEFQSYGDPEFALDAVRQILMINAWPIVGSGAHWVPPMWSLSVEFFCYLAIFPGVVLATRPMLKRSGSFVLATAIIAAFVSYGVTIKFYQPIVNEHHAIHAAVAWQARWTAVWRGTAMFVAGWSAYVLWAQDDDVSRSVMRQATCVGLAMVLILIGADMLIVDRQLIVWLAPLLVLGLMNERALVSRILSSRPLHFLGLISYSVYLIHWPLFQVCMMTLRSWNDGSKSAAAALLTPILASVAYYGFERPARNLLRQRLIRLLSVGRAPEPHGARPAALTPAARN